MLSTSIPRRLSTILFNTMFNTNNSSNSNSTFFCSNNSLKMVSCTMLSTSSKRCPPRRWPLSISFLYKICKWQLEKCSRFTRSFTSRVFLSQPIPTCTKVTGHFLIMIFQGFLMFCFRNPHLVEGLFQSKSNLGSPLKVGAVSIA